MSSDRTVIGKQSTNKGQVGRSWLDSETERVLKTHGINSDAPILRVWSRALDLFGGDTSKAWAWLARPQPAFGGATALSLMQTEAGAREVEDLIGRIEHGIIY